jgi:putative transposase
MKVTFRGQLRGPDSADRSLPKGSRVFVPIQPLVRVEHAFARLGRWRRLARCYEGTIESAQAWLEIACLSYPFTRLRAEPP